VQEDFDAAFSVSGFKAAVFKPQFGNAHQQYFTPKWLAEAMCQIAEHAFHSEPQGQHGHVTLNVLDPTAGSGRLLVPFKKNGHRVIGIELDERLARVATRALGKKAVRRGDIMVYAPLISSKSWQVVVTNPPFGLWWPTTNVHRRRYQLATGENVESQHFILNLAHDVLNYNNGLLLGIFSGKFFDKNPKARQFLGKNFQIIALLTLPKPFKDEYGIDVDAAFVVATGDSSYTSKREIPLEGVFEGDGPMLVRQVCDAFDQVRTMNPSYTSSYISYLATPYLRGNPDVPNLDMAVDVGPMTLHLKLTARGISPQNNWASIWLKFYNSLPVQDYDIAQGTYAPLGEARGSLPNILINGVETTRRRLTELGFEVTLTDHDAQQIELRARRYERDRLPVRELEPMEYLAYYEDGPITARATVRLPDGTLIPEGTTYELRSRWFRQEEQAGAEEEKGKGSKRYVQRTYVDRGYLVLRFTPGIGLPPFTVSEVEPQKVKAVVDAFGLPEVKTVDDTPDLIAWKNRLVTFMDQHQEAAGGRRLYPIQALDVARMATKSSVALLYEMGGGKTATIAHWATMRSYRDVLIVTPASVVSGIIEDLNNWGFPARRLDHKLVSNLKARKRQHRLARERVKAAAQARSEEQKNIVHYEKCRVDTEKKLARKKRHLRNLRAIQAKGKGRPEIQKEIDETAFLVSELTDQLADIYDALGDVYEPPQETPNFYVTSYQDLSLGDHLGIFDPWDHDHFDRQGNYLGTVSDLRGARCTCGSPRKKALPVCPKCGTPWRGENSGGGRVCRKCGYVAWTMGKAPVHILPEMSKDAPRKQQIETRKRRIEILKQRRTALTDEGLSTPRQSPLAPRIRALFSCVILDEGQDAKSKLSLRGAAARSLRARGRAILTGTWMKGYVHDLFWTAGWLLGFGSPLWPFPYRGGSARFLKQFGTYEYVTKEFANSLEVGKRKLIPSVSNLNRLWKLLSPVSIRRLKEDLLEDLPPKHRHIQWLEITGQHAVLANRVTEMMKEVLTAEMRKADPNMGAISAALWWGRYVASCPNEYGALHFAGAWGFKVNVDEISPGRAKAILAQMRMQNAYILPRPGHRAGYNFNKVQETLKLVQQIKAKGEKVIVFTSLRGLYRTLEAAFKDFAIPFVGMDGVPTRRRNDVVRQFEAGDATVLLAGTGTLNRGVTVNGANHIIILNLEWSPETTLQAEDRCHRPGQTKEVHVYYLLSQNSVDEQMWELVSQKWSAQQAVQDRKAEHKSVEAILADAALANAQLAVAKAVLADLTAPRPEKEPEPATPTVEGATSWLEISKAHVQRSQARKKNKAPVVFYRDLGKTVKISSMEPVQLAMFEVTT